MRAWIRVLDAPGCYERAAWAERRPHYKAQDSVGPCAQRRVALKALCHAISADCLLIEAARAHAVNEHWASRMADKFACTFKSAR